MTLESIIRIPPKPCTTMCSVVAGVCETMLTCVVCAQHGRVEQIGDSIISGSPTIIHHANMILEVLDSGPTHHFLFDRGYCVSQRYHNSFQHLIIVDFNLITATTSIGVVRIGSNGYITRHENGDAACLRRSGHHAHSEST